MRTVARQSKESSQDTRVGEMLGTDITQGSHVFVGKGLKLDQVHNCLYAESRR